MLVKLSNISSSRSVVFPIGSSSDDDSYTTTLTFSVQSAGRALFPVTKRVSVSADHMTFPLERLGAGNSTYDMG